MNLIDPTGMSAEESGDGDPPKKGFLQKISDGLANIFNFNIVRDANKLAASKGQDQ